MKVLVNLPDDISKFLKDNPNVGRLRLQEEFTGMNSNIARGFAFIGHMLHATPQDDSAASKLLEAFKITIDKEIDPGKSAKIKADVFTPADFVDEDSLVQQVIKESGMNNDYWFPKKVSVKRWTTGMKIREFTDIQTKDGRWKPAVSGETMENAIQWSVHIDFIYNEKAPLYDSLRQLALDVPPLAKPIELKPPLKPNKDIAVLIEIADVHFGKLACGVETLLGNMDLPIAVKLFNEAVDDILEQVARVAPAQIFIVVGHDLLHYENLAAMTIRGGNHLDTDSRLPKVFIAAEKCLIRLFDKAMQIAPTHGIWVEGNHDSIASFALASVLEQRAQLTKHFTIDRSMSIMKRIMWGNTLIGLTHNVSGSKLKRAVDYFKDVFREDYAKCMWSELHAGHTHKAEVKPADHLQTIGRTKLRIVSALSTVDRWHLENFFTDAAPAAEAFVIHKSEGIINNIIKNINYFKD
jgi:hypothetical protein